MIFYASAALNLSVIKLQCVAAMSLHDLLCERYLEPFGKMYFLFAVS
jgi:hypothetical protein